MSDFFWFSDEQWARIVSMTDARGMKRVDDRRVLSGIVHVLKCGGRWSDYADVYGPKKTLYNRFVRWADRGIWEGIYSAHWQVLRTPPTGCSSTGAASRSTVVPAAQKGGLAHGIGITRGGRNTKLHAVCDAKGRPCVLLLTLGNAHDCKVAQACIEAMPPSAALVADKGYDSQALREWLAGRCTQAVIPPRRNRKIQYEYDKAIYKQRNIVELLFCRIKDWRRSATIVIWWLQ